MKKIVSLVLLVAMLVCVSNCAVYAENTSTYTADELAYTAYVEIDAVYHSSIRYLNTLGGLWESLADKATWDDVSVSWLLNYCIADGDSSEGIQRIMFFDEIGEKKLGIEDLVSTNKKALVDAIKEEATAHNLTDPKSAIFILLEWGQEVGYLKNEETFEAELGNGMEAIRMIMGLDANYAYLNTLKDYYKEAAAIHDYLVDFSDDYISFTSKMEQYQANYDSWEIEFDFIFGTDSYKTYGDAYSRFIEEREAQAQ